MHDACVFPMLSKAVSSNQAMVYGSQLLKGEELNKTVMEVFENKVHLPAIARAFTGHNQIVCSILEHDGDNDYLSKRGGMHFGVRRMYMTDEEGEGVIPVPLAMVEGETIQAQIMNERRAKGLKYKEPSMDVVKKGILTDEMRDFLLANMDGERLSDGLAEYWMRAVDPNWMADEDGGDGEDVGREEEPFEESTV